MGVLGYFGPEGTFTHQALLTLGHREGRPYPSVAQCLDAVRAGEVTGCVLPIENSVEGGVSATLDYLAKPDAEHLMIANEVVIPVNFTLAVRPGTTIADVKRVVTHPHAAAQCRDWLANVLPHAQLVERGSTAGAAEEVSDPDSPYDAAICAPVAAQLYGLESLCEKIADNDQAVTRFVEVTRQGPPTQRTGADKTTLVAYMRVDHPGALLEILQQFAVRGVNLCRIESRPTKTVLGSYCFSIDAEGHIHDARMAEALMGLKRVCKDVVFLGSYPRADAVPPKVPYGGRDADYISANGWLRTLS